MSDINLKDILGKDPKNCTSEEIAAATDELQKLLNSAQVEQHRAARREERRENQKKRANYRLSTDPYRKEHNLSQLLEDIRDHFQTETILTATQFAVILKSCSYTLPNEFSKVYPCPECGKNSLYVGSFPRSAKSGGYMRRVVCGCCDWQCPRSASSDYDARDAFVYYLNKQGFLGENKPKLEDMK